MSGIGRSVVSVAAFSSTTQSAADRQNISNVLSSFAWSGTTNLTYSFPTSGSFYGPPADYGSPPDTSPYTNFAVLEAAQQTEAIRAFALVQSYTNLSFSAVTESDTTHAYIRLANSSVPPTAYGYYPSTLITGGDSFFGGTGRNPPPAMGNFNSASAVLHEIGHTLGLKHGQDNDTYGLMRPDRLDIEFALMNYPNYIGDTNTASVAGSFPKTYMMYDIAALQYMYGANFSAEGQSRTYSWSSTTGELFINGVSQGVPHTNHIFETVWTAGASATYDLSNYSQDQVDDMTPGGWMLFSTSQRSHLNAFAAAKPDGEIFARGNVFNTLTFNGDARSLIANLTAGAGNDTVTGNDINNTINGGAGNDTLLGGAGNDTLIGGGGINHLVGGVGADGLDGTVGLSFADYSTAAAGVIASLLTPGSNTGDAAGDSYTAIFGLTGSAFADTLQLGSSSGSIWAGAGNDTAVGSTGNDDLHGQAGIDHLVGGAGADVLDGTGGISFADYSTAASGVIASLLTPVSNTGDAAGDSYTAIFGLTGSSFADTLQLGSSAGSIWAGAGNDTAVGSAGNDDLHGQVGIDHLVGGAGADVLDGTGGISFADYSTALAGVIASLLTPGSNTGDAAGDSYTAIFGLIGSSFADTLQLANSAGSIWAGAGNDTAVGSAGNDDLHGQAGIDHLIGGAGADALDGSIGLSFADYSTAGSSVLANLANTGSNTGDAAGDSYNMIFGITGSGFADTLTLGSAAGSIWSGSGNDVLFGGAGGDDLHGQDGNDLLVGGLGADQVEGGAGNDIFAFQRGDGGGDTVADFIGSGVDSLRFTGFGTAAQGATFTLTGGNQWSINSADGQVHDVVIFANSASIQASDYVFV